MEVLCIVLTVSNLRKKKNRKRKKHMARSKVLLVTGGYDHSIRFWDVSSGSMVKQIQVCPARNRGAPTPHRFARYSIIRSI
jgi:hypothetical protein